MDTIELKDFLDFTYLSDVALSPDGSRAAYLRHRCDTEKDGYATQLWVTGPDGHGAAVGAEGKKPLVAWESGDTLLYGVPGGEATSFTRYYAATGLSVPAFTVPLEARSIEALGGGIYLLSARTVLHPQDRQDDDCVIVTDLPVQSNGTGYVSGTRISLFLFDIRDGGLSRLRLLPLKPCSSAIAPNGRKSCCRGNALRTSASSREAFPSTTWPTARSGRC